MPPSCGSTTAKRDSTSSSFGSASTGVAACAASNNPTIIMTHPLTSMPPNLERARAEPQEHTGLRRRSG
ncbi:hypothetical protein GCM10022281_20550 [Sphingomonas rosea]|uniref:Uncharacterized protein n=1 Tax=Sphingomonas rosea TaxID=335605 RepID=A0ABP7UBF4_9SPHN